MFRFWVRGTVDGHTPTPRQIAAECDVSIHAARSTARRFRSGIVPTRDYHPGLARKTVRNIHVMLHRAFDDAVAWKYIDSNPATAAKLPKIAKRRTRVWTEIATFMRTAESDASMRCSGSSSRPA